MAEPLEFLRRLYREADAQAKEFEMGVRELRDAFNEVASPTASCMKALMEYKPSGGMEYQILIFSGHYADGEGFVIQSELIRPSGDLIIASRATAEALLNRTRVKP